MKKTRRLMFSALLAVSLTIAVPVIIFGKGWSMYHNKDGTSYSVRYDIDNKTILEKI